MVWCVVWLAANIQRVGDGLFLECCREMAKQYPQLKYKEMQIDNVCLQLVRDPTYVSRPTHSLRLRLSPVARASHDSLDLRCCAALHV